jgi:hypothetical protein
MSLTVAAGGGLGFNLTIVGAGRIIAVASRAVFRLCYYIIIAKRREEEFPLPALIFANMNVVNGFTARSWHVTG